SMNQRPAQQTRRDHSPPRKSTIPFHVVTTSPPVDSWPYLFQKSVMPFPKLLLSLEPIVCRTLHASWPRRGLRGPCGSPPSHRRRERRDRRELGVGAQTGRPARCTGN